MTAFTALIVSTMLVTVTANYEEFMIIPIVSGFLGALIHMHSLEWKVCIINHFIFFVQHFMLLIRSGCERFLALAD